MKTHKRTNGFESLFLGPSPPMRRSLRIRNKRLQEQSVGRGEPPDPPRPSKRQRTRAEGLDARRHVEVLAVQRLERWVAAHAWLDPTERCPITLDTRREIFHGGGRVILFHISETKTQLYNADALARYIESTGKFEDPLSRRPLNDVDLARLRRITRKPLDRAAGELLRRQQMEMESLRNFLLNDVVAEVQTLVRYYVQYALHHTGRNMGRLVGLIRTWFYPQLIAIAVRVEEHDLGETVWPLARLTLRRAVGLGEADDPLLDTALANDDDTLINLVMEPPSGDDNPGANPGDNGTGALPELQHVLNILHLGDHVLRIPDRDGNEEAY